MSENENPPFMLTDQSTKEVIAMRKIEVLLDVLRALEESNSPELYGIKLNVVDKIDKAVNKL